MTMKLGIVGYGVVGKALAKVFHYDAGNSGLVIYDKFVKGMNSPSRRTALQRCDLVFIAVPTPEGPDGRCDLSAIEEVVSWIKPVMCVKSTVPPGTVDRLAAETGSPADPTGSAGLAGLLDLLSTGTVGPDERVAVLYTGVRRGP